MGFIPCLPQVINVEIDGVHHRQSKKRRFCAARDEYLHSRHGVRIVRLDVIALSKLSDDAKIAHIRAQLEGQREQQ